MAATFAAIWLYEFIRFCADAVSASAMSSMVFSWLAKFIRLIVDCTCVMEILIFFALFS